jgi:hypothetical protein
MSYDISIVDSKTGDTIQVSENHFLRGAIYCPGGTKELWVSVTFNYSSFFVKAFLNNKGIKILNGMAIKDSLPMLVSARSNLSGDPHESYWEATEGNARKAVTDLIYLALLAPDEAIWKVSA